MNPQYLFAMLVCITAVASYINVRLVRLPKAIGLTLISLSLSIILILLLSIGQLWVVPIKNFLSSIDFNQAVLKGMLSYLLFAGAIHINSVEMYKHKLMIGTLATASVLISCLIIAYLMWLVTRLIGLDMNLMYFLLFGALISPTDPICVIGAMKTVKMPKSIRMKITGESLFNDAASILLFVILLEIMTGQTHHLSYMSIGLMLLIQGGGGILLGWLLGMLTAKLITRVDAETAIIITLACVSGGYAISTIIEVSAPISMVVAGLVIGTRARQKHFKPDSSKRLYDFWELIDDMLNAFLFVMIGLEILSIHVPLTAFAIGSIGFVVVTTSRLISVAIPLAILEPLKSFNWRTISVMTWGGMRGGLSIALALAMPNIPGKNAIISMTYGVVIASILIQGLSLKPLLKKLYPENG